MQADSKANVAIHASCLIPKKRVIWPAEANLDESI